MTRLRMRKGGGSDDCQSPWSLYPHAVDLPVQDVLRLVCVDIESYVIHLVSENLLAHVDVYAVKLAKGSEGLSCVMHRVAGAQRIINGCKHLAEAAVAAVDKPVSFLQQLLDDIALDVIVYRYHPVPSSLRLGASYEVAYRHVCAVIAACLVNMDCIPADPNKLGGPATRIDVDEDEMSLGSVQLPQPSYLVYREWIMLVRLAESSHPDVRSVVRVP